MLDEIEFDLIQQAISPVLMEDYRFMLTWPCRIVILHIFLSKDKTHFWIIRYLDLPKVIPKIP